MHFLPVCVFTGSAHSVTYRLLTVCVAGSPLSCDCLLRGQGISGRYHGLERQRCCPRCLDEQVTELVTGGETYLFGQKLEFVLSPGNKIEHHCFVTPPGGSASDKVTLNSTQRLETWMGLKTRTHKPYLICELLL